MFEIGTSLREARLRQGFELVDAEAATKIRSKYLGALEEERFELLPAQTYVKGFLRSYSEYLGLDGQLYVDEYNSRYAQGEEPEPVVRRRIEVSHAQRRVESRVLVVSLAGIAAATGLVFAAWKWGGDDQNRIPNLADGAAAVPTSRQGGATAPTPRQRWIRLIVTARRGSSLLAVHRGSATGRTLWSGTLERGETRHFVGPSLWLNVGSPTNLAARLNGSPVALPPTRRGPAQLIVTRRGITRGRPA